jgi:pantothenate kinase
LKDTVDANAIAARQQLGQRFIVAIAGATGARKSTFADALCKALNKGDASCAAVLPMDGFHLDNAISEIRGILDKKGAPETFDGEGFASVLSRICADDRDVVVPVFDRDLDVPIETLKKRLIQRWLDHVLDLDAATARMRDNHMKNAKLVNCNSLPADIRVNESDPGAGSKKESLEC